MLRHLPLMFVLLITTYLSAFAQTGMIRGQLTDASNGEAIIGASVVIANTTNGAATDLDGKYTIKGLAPGTYDINASFIGYEAKTITGIEVKAGEVTVMNIALGEEAEMLEAVVIEAKAERGAMNAMLAVQKKAGVVQDGLAAEQISRAGDSNVAGAIKRVTGVSVEGGKYVYVRGLGDRYSKTTLNGAELPGLDPNRNTVQMDLFPSNLIDNLVVSKTFAPNMPASFTGGYVNIVTKDFPDRFTLQFSNSFGYNTNASFNNNFLTYKGGKTDWLGIDDGTRELPAEIKDGVASSFVSEEKDKELDADTKSFSRLMAPSTKSPFLNHRHSIAVGNQIDVLGKPFGFIAGLTYQRKYGLIKNGKTQRFKLPGSATVVEELNPEYLLETQKGTEEVIWGGVLNLSYKVSEKSKIALNLMHNRSGKKLADAREGQFAGNGIPSEKKIYQTKVLQFLERSLSAVQLKGEHAFSNEGLKLDWLTSYTLSTQDEPDLRFFSSDYLILENGTKKHRIQAAGYPEPSRYFRDMKEFNWDTKLNLTLPFDFNGNTSKLKGGVAYVLKDRDFNEKRFQYDQQSGADTLFSNTGNAADFLSDKNLGVDPTISTAERYKTIIKSATEPRNSYTGTERIAAVYLMADWKLTDKWRAIVGARYERTDILVESKKEGLEKGRLEGNDILPALNLTYAITDNMNFRAAYGRTLARPTFRELAQYPTFDFVGDFILVGNAALKRTLVDNIDLRWEMYPNPGELFTVSTFFKNFSNPIARVFKPEASNLEQQYKNIDKATVFGVELEARKKLDFISSSLQNFSIGTNLTFVKSVVNIEKEELALIRTIDPSRKSTRQMSGQSPFIINAYANYDNPDNGLKANINFNVFGQRLATIGANGVPDVFEQPRPSLDFSISKLFGEHFKASFRAKNLLDPTYKFTQTFKNKEYIYNSYTRGRTFSIGVTYMID